MSYRYPLQTYPWSFLDRIKIAKFVLNPANRLTCGPKTVEWEKQFEDFVNGTVTGEDLGNKVKCVATSSGSTANATMLEAFLQGYNINPKDTMFFCNSTTWGSNVSHLIMRGCGVNFVDINLQDFCFDYDKLEKTIAATKSKVKVIWVTALIGWTPNVDRLKQIARNYDCYLFADLCESTGSFYGSESLLSCFDMATTSGFLAHFVSGIEAGMIFIKESKQTYYEVALSVRNHGLTRGLPPDSEIRIKAEKENPDIDPQFLFEFIGTNYRISDLHAYFAILDTKRLNKYIEHRERLANVFFGKLNPDKYHIDFAQQATPFCLPILRKDDKSIKEIKEALNKKGWETRPVISFLALSPAYKKYRGRKSYSNSQYLHDRGCYVGLSNQLTQKDVINLCKELNNL